MPNSFFNATRDQTIQYFENVLRRPLTQEEINNIDHRLQQKAAIRDAIIEDTAESNTRATVLYRTFEKKYGRSDLDVLSIEDTLVYQFWYDVNVTDDVQPT